MEIYKFCLYLGFTGMAAITLLGISHTVQGIESGHNGHSHDGHGGADPSDGALHPHDADGARAVLHDAPRSHARRPRQPSRRRYGSFLLSLASPRVFFSLLLGFGATGMVLPSTLVPEPFKFAVAVGGGWGFEHLIVAPIWNFMFRFASKPARTLESAVCEEAQAVTNFDASGNGLIAIDLDGQIVQVLGTLSAQQRAGGTRVRAGDRLFVEAVDTKRNSCTVSLFNS